MVEYAAALDDGALSSVCIGSLAASAHTATSRSLAGGLHNAWALVGYVEDTALPNRG